MLECYFDDSGTHAKSTIAVWGGILGSADGIRNLCKRWRELLTEPFDGKQPIKKFSASHCANAFGEFAEYKPAERDLLRRRFRDVIIEEDVFPIAYIVSVRDWDAVLNCMEKRLLGVAQHAAFKGCMDIMGRIASESGENISCHFDEGQFTVGINSVLTAWRLTNSQVETRISTEFSSVAAVYGLQAADTIAYDAYQYGVHLEDPERHPLSPHFEDLKRRKGAFFNSLHKPEIEKWIDPIRKGLQTVDGIRG